MDSWLNMEVVCGLLLIASLQTTTAFRFRRSRAEINTKLSPILSNLISHYNTRGTGWIGKHVFSSHIDHLNSKASCSCQDLLLEGMLNIYEEIFQDMLNKSEKKEVKTDLKDVMSEVKKLRHKYSEEMKVWRELQDIHSIKVKNGTVQGAALNDFHVVFDRAITNKHKTNTSHS